MVVNILTTRLFIVWPLVPTHCTRKCRELLLHRSHSHTHTHAR